jgi:hypothetical protein
MSAKIKVAVQLAVARPLMPARQYTTDWIRVPFERQIAGFGALFDS